MKPTFDPSDPKNHSPHSALHYAAIIASSDDAIISKSIEGIIETWNPAAERIFGYRAEEIIGKPVQILMPPELEDEEPGILARIRKGDRIDHYETVRRRKDGRLIPISLTVSPIRDEAGKVIGASKIVRDLSDRQSDELLRRRLAAIVESSDDAIISKDLDGVIQSWNAGAERMFGYTQKEVIGRPITMLIPLERISEEPAILDRVRKGERIDHYETVRRRKDGELINVSLAVSPIRDGQGKVVGASKIARDITERIKAQKALEEARKALDLANSELEKRVAERTASLNEAVAQMHEFSYTVSHDLRSPVRAMQAYAEAALEDFGKQLGSDGAEYLEKIISGGVRMEKMIRDVLIYSRITSSKYMNHVINLDQLVAEIISQYEEFQAPKADITIQSPLLTVNGNDTLLGQAIANLLSNAAKFVTPGTLPQINVLTEGTENRTRLWIKDRGIGIKPEYQSLIFGMFERANQDAHYEGTGVGLAIARRAIEKMGGTIGVESDGANGSAFWIELPTPGQ
jgi:PAS domain S-box-containing protein